MAGSRRLRWSCWGISMALILLSACTSLGGDRTTEVTIEVNDVGFRPSTIEIAAGELAKLTLKNSGSVEHQLGIDEIPLVTQGGGMAGHNMAGMDSAMAVEAEQLQVHLVSAPGATTSLELIPSVIGEYLFRCVAPGHMEQGTLIVTR